MKLLIIEDDPKIISFVQKGLQEEGFIVDAASDGEEGLYLAEQYTYDLLIIDWMLPKLDGLKICEKLREKKNLTPILMLTAKTSVEERILGLGCGADDYLVKPFVFAELVARIRSLLRRSSYNFNECLTLDTLEVNVSKRVVTRSKNPITLTSKEFDILVYLLLNQNTIITHTQLQEKIWGINETTSSNIINVFIHHLRHKIDIEGEKPLIKTIRGSGYKIESL
ncbi:response regulator transcription factor [Sulfurospirillum sp. UCH001]|uniref:response regulator transcription factor n=1 Tax=Sulfurospirillum sp. UCH001 TaxID=1581011 RepID=UPI00082DB705|nr:response regulator transcription factor [Sulfurospirillum sp. UCH001]